MFQLELKCFRPRDHVWGETSGRSVKVHIVVAFVVEVSFCRVILVVNVHMIVGGCLVGKAYGAHDWYYRRKPENCLLWIEVWCEIVNEKTGKEEKIYGGLMVSEESQESGTLGIEVLLLFVQG
jgi:hypothetical protein